jgi:hypothetical protein
MTNSLVAVGLLLVGQTGGGPVNGPWMPTYGGTPLPEARIGVPATVPAGYPQPQGTPASYPVPLPTGPVFVQGDPRANSGYNGDTKKDNGQQLNQDCANRKAEEPTHPGFFYNFLKAYHDEFCPKKKDTNGNGNDKGNSNGNGTGNGNGGDNKDEEPARRALPSPWKSPPFPGSEYQGYPLIGVPPSTTVYPFMKGIYALPCGDAVKETRIKFDGWAVASGNWSTATNSNTPESYWIVPNRYELDQLVFRFQRELDTVQTDHIDWGFRALLMYGMDYRYMTAGGWFSDQLLRNNLLYGWDPTELYFDMYIPWIGEGGVFRVGRWIACPDIETQWAPDNYMGTHSLQFTVDTYTQTGIMYSQRLTEQWMVQAALHAGTDMAPWYRGAIPTGAFGARWVSKDNNDSVYAWLNAINDSEFRHFQQYGQPLGHDNFNYFVATWQHRFTEQIHTKTEAYYMWEMNAELGGTPSAGPLKSFGGGGGDAPTIPGLSRNYGFLNYVMFAFSDMDYLTVRNEWMRDETGFRYGAPGNYTSHAIGISHYFNNLFIVRPEIGYYRNWTNPVFDLNTRHGIWQYGFDMILRF